MVAKRDLIEALNDAGIDFKSNFESQCGSLLDEFKQQVATLLGRAQSTGAVRRDTSVEEVLGLIGGVCHSGAQAGIVDRGHATDGRRHPGRPAGELS